MNKSRSQYTPVDFAAKQRALGIICMNAVVLGDGHFAGKVTD